jgi:transcriptional regulator with XRE-family HTH domain
LNYNKIKSLASENKISLKELADKINLSEQGLHSGIKKQTLSVTNLEKIAEVLEVPVSYFFEDKEDVKKIINNTNGNIQVGQNNKSNAKTESEALAVCRKEIEGLKRENELLRKMVEMLEKGK